MDRFVFCDYLSNMAYSYLFRLQPNMKCIIFVNRIVTARSLSCILQSLEFLASWKCDFLVGVNAGLKGMSRKTMNIILEKFRSGKVMLFGRFFCTNASCFIFPAAFQAYFLPSSSLQVSFRNTRSQNL